LTGKYNQRVSCTGSQLGPHQSPPFRACGYEGLNEILGCGRNFLAIRLVGTPGGGQALDGGAEASHEQL
jgi:hypothetical protein